MHRGGTRATGGYLTPNLPDHIPHFTRSCDLVAPGTIELRNHSFDTFGALDGIRGGGVGKFVERYMD